MNEIGLTILLTTYVILTIIGIVILIYLCGSNDRLHSEIKPIVFKAKNPKLYDVVKNGYQPIHDTLGKYPPGYKPKVFENLMQHEQSLSFVASVFNQEVGKIVIEPKEINVIIVKDVKTSFAGIIVGDNDMINITKEQLSTIIKFLS